MGTITLHVGNRLSFGSREGIVLSIVSGQFAQIRLIDGGNETVMLRIWGPTSIKALRAKYKTMRESKRWKAASSH